MTQSEGLRVEFEPGPLPRTQPTLGYRGSAVWPTGCTVWMNSAVIKSVELYSALFFIKVEQLWLILLVRIPAEVIRITSDINRQPVV